MRIHMWSADEAGSAMYRAVLPGMSLQWLGHTVSGGMKLPPDWDSLDAVVGCRVAKPGPSTMWRQMKDRGIRLVLDVDDDYFHLDPANEQAVRTWTPVMQRSLASNMALADVVTCCSEPLAAVLRDHAADVRVIPNGLPAQYLGEVRDYSPDVLNIGWAGTASTVAELPLAARALNRIAGYRPSVRVRLVGVDAQQAQAAGMRPHPHVGVLGWVKEFGHYLQAVSAFDVWVAPYRDTAFNRAKYPTKFLESSMLGIPLIASDVEPYREVIRHGENGFLVPVGQEHEFGRQLKALADDPALRKRIGMAARAGASGSILQAVNRQWETVLTASVGAAA